VVSGCSFLALLMMLINGVPLFAAGLWLGAGIALLLWTFGRHRPWWQGIVTWIGGAFAGHAVGFLGLTRGVAAGLLFVAVFFLIGVALLWLGFRKLKKRDAGDANREEMNSEKTA
jgi:hypothetical protein